MAVRRSLAFVLVGLLLFSGAWTPAWGLFSSYNRPCPLMDYVAQEIGILDSNYWDLSEEDCRRCHGNNLAPRHHNTPVVRTWGFCDPCHDIIEESPGVIVYKDCIQSAGVSGCHNWYSPSDVPSNGWHHNTDLSRPENCVSCHDPNLVSPINALQTIAECPPPVTMPTPYSCENCHWGQETVAALAGFDPETSPSRYAGHPSTYQHVDGLGKFIGYFRYGTPIADLYETHHVGFKGGFSGQCAGCHSQDPNDPGWEYSDPELIRYCEKCHDYTIIHGILPHVEETPGWEAIGFHSGSGVLTPETYRNFSAGEQCLGCHPEGVNPSVQPCSPAIRLGCLGIDPKFANDGTLVTLSGKCFGEPQSDGQAVQIENVLGGAWSDISALSWTDDRIVFQIPENIGAPGNFWVRVRNADGAWPFSNKVGLTLTGSGPELISLRPEWVTCGTWLRLVCDSNCFSDYQESMLDGYRGQYYVVDFVSPSGHVFTALRQRNWHPNSIEVRFFSLFEDLPDSATGARNFIQDESESTIRVCENLEHGSYSVFVRRITFGDEDANGQMSLGDIILDVEPGVPLNFDYIDAPYILKLRSDAVERGKRLRVLGVGFGKLYVDGEVRIGGKAKAKDPTLGQGKLLNRIRTWTDTKVAVKLKVPMIWQGKTKFVWVERNGYKSNYKRLKILPAQ